MALSRAAGDSDSSVHCTFGSRYVQQSLPRFRMPDMSIPKEAAYQIISDELMLDGNPRLNLASFVTTWMEPECDKLIMQGINKNYVDMDEYPVTTELQNRCVNIIANLFNAPLEAGEEAVGVGTIGSSEAIMLAGLAFKRKWQIKRKEQGKPHDKPNIVTGANVQVCWEKFARYFAENLVQDLLGGFQYEIQVPYLLYQSSAEEVTGIWFYNQHECEEIANLFNRILSAFSKVPPKPKAFTTKSTEFQELERVPTSAIMEGPLEPTESAPSTDAEVSEEPFEHFFGALHLNNHSNITSSAPMMPSAVTQTLLSQSLRSSSPMPTPMPIPSPPSPAPSLPKGLMDRADVPTGRLTTLVKPSFFLLPPSSSTLMPPLIFSTPAAPPLQPPSHLQPSHGEPLLQPFPPPAPSPSLTPASSMSHGPIITRDGIRNALLRLVQNEHFIDMVYREMMNAHLS